MQTINVRYNRRPDGERLANESAPGARVGLRGTGRGRSLAIRPASRTAAAPSLACRCPEANSKSGIKFQRDSNSYSVRVVRTVGHPSMGPRTGALGGRAIPNP